MSIVPMIHDENEFQLLRHQLLSETTVDEHIQASRLARSIDFNHIPTELDPLIKSKVLQRQDKAKRIFLHHNYEKQYVHHGKDIHRLWNRLFARTPIEETRLIVGTRNNPNLMNELVRRNPKIEKIVRDNPFRLDSV